MTRRSRRRQRKRLAEVKAHRSAERVERALAAVRAAAGQAETNLMPAIIEAAGAYATLGEIMTALGDVFGYHVETPVL